MFACSSDKNDPGGTICLTNGYVCGVSHGIVDFYYNDTRSYCRYAGKERANQLRGTLKLSKPDAVELARNTLKTLGYEITDLYADCEPPIFEGPFGSGTNLVPYYNLTWMGPFGDYTCNFEIDGEHGVVTYMELGSSTIWKPTPEIDIAPQELAPGEVPDYAKKVPSLEASFRRRAAEVITPEVRDLRLREAIEAVSQCSEKLKLPIATPVTTNQVEFFSAKWRKMYLTNGYEFVIAPGYVMEFKTPLSFYAGRLNTHVSNYWGKWNMNEREAVRMARETVRKLGYWSDTSYFEKAPNFVRKPQCPGTHVIPRYLIRWEHQIRAKAGEPVLIDAYADVEVDADAGVVRSFHAGRPLGSRDEPERR